MICLYDYCIVPISVMVPTDQLAITSLKLDFSPGLAGQTIVIHNQYCAYGISMIRCNRSILYDTFFLSISHLAVWGFNGGSVTSWWRTPWPERGNCSGIKGGGTKLEWVLEAGATLIEKQQRWWEGADFLHGRIDKEDTDKKTGETQASIKGVCVGAASRNTQVSKGVRKC